MRKNHVGLLCNMAVEIQPELRYNIKCIGMYSNMRLEAYDYEQ